ncbi:hypothetical protein FAIPA1_270032 [Frankia sp. AiPs1]
MRARRPDADVPHASPALAAVREQGTGEDPGNGLAPRTQDELHRERVRRVVAQRARDGGPSPVVRDEVSGEIAHHDMRGRRAVTEHSLPPNTIGTDPVSIAALSALSRSPSGLSPQAEQPASHGPVGRPGPGPLAPSQLRRQVRASRESRQCGADGGACASGVSLTRAPPRVGVSPAPRRYQPIGTPTQAVTVGSLRAPPAGTRGGDGE